MHQICIKALNDHVSPKMAELRENILGECRTQVAANSPGDDIASLWAHVKQIQADMVTAAGVLQEVRETLQTQATQLAQVALQSSIEMQERSLQEKMEQIIDERVEKLLESKIAQHLGQMSLKIERISKSCADQFASQNQDFGARLAQIEGGLRARDQQIADQFDSIHEQFCEVDRRMRALQELCESWVENEANQEKLPEKTPLTPVFETPGATKENLSVPSIFASLAPPSTPYGLGKSPMDIFRSKPESPSISVPTMASKPSLGKSSQHKHSVKICDPPSEKFESESSSSTSTPIPTKPTKTVGKKALKMLEEFDDDETPPLGCPQRPNPCQFPTHRLQNPNL